MTTIKELIEKEKIDEYLFNLKDFNGLCISSGGENIYIFIGILHYLDIHGKLDSIKYFTGTSAGAILCLLIILGYKPIEILSYLTKNDISLIFAPTVNGIKDGFGLYDISLSKLYLTEMIKIKFNNKIPTFKELYDKTNKIFYCTTYCLNDTQEKYKYLSYKTSPDLSILEGIVASSSIPFIFTKNYIEDKCYIDGAVFNYYPLEKLYEIMSEDLEDKHINIFSIKLCTTNNNVNTFSGYVGGILNILYTNQDKVKDSIMTSIYNKNVTMEIVINKDSQTFNFKENSLERANKVIEGIRILKVAINKRL